MKNKSAKYITTGGIIAALYIVLTLLSHALGLANGQIQVRLSEALCVLPAFTPAAIPGLFVGCLISNILTGGMLPDVIFGSLATLAGAVGTGLIVRMLRKNHHSAADKLRTGILPVLPPVIVNSIAIPLVLYFAYGVGPLVLNFATITAGEIISAGVLGVILYSVLNKRKDEIFR